MSQEKKEHTVFGLRNIWEEGDSIGRESKSGVAKHFMWQAWRGLIDDPGTTILTVITIAITLFLLAAFISVLEHLNGMIAVSRGEVSLSIYIKDGTGPSRIDEIRKLVLDEAAVLEAEIRSKEAALEWFRKSLGDQKGLLYGLEDRNPLPASIEVRFKGSGQIEQTIERLENGLRQENAIDSIQYNRGFLGQVHQFIRVMRIGGIVGMALMLIVTGFIIANTLKLAMHSYRDEIAIMQLVGATPLFIRIPYVIEGAMHGFIGACVGLTAFSAFFEVLRQTVSRSEFLRVVLPPLTSLSASAMVLVLLLGITVGLLGSYHAVRDFVEQR